MHQGIPQVRIEQRFPLGREILAVLGADAIQTQELVMHPLQSFLRTTMGIHAGTDSFHVRQTGLQQILADELLKALHRLEGHGVRQRLVHLLGIEAQVCP